MRRPSFDRVCVLASGGRRVGFFDLETEWACRKQYLCRRISDDSRHRKGPTGTGSGAAFCRRHKLAGDPGRLELTCIGVNWLAPASKSGAGLELTCIGVNWLAPASKSGAGLELTCIGGDLAG
jgi:hypothetical protein